MIRILNYLSNFYNFNWDGTQHRICYKITRMKYNHKGQLRLFNIKYVSNVLLILHIGNKTYYRLIYLRGNRIINLHRNESLEPVIIHPRPQYISLLTKNSDFNFMYEYNGFLN